MRVRNVSPTRYPQNYRLHRQTIVKSFDLAKELNHDVYDCVYLAAAEQENAQAIIITDLDFKELCERAELDYINPVPAKVLKQFKG